MTARNFGQRWLQMGLKEIAETDFTSKVSRAEARQKRFPFLFQKIYVLALWILEWIGPTLFLKRFQKASQLSDDFFSHYLDWLQSSKFYLVRITTIFVLAPYMEVFADEKFSSALPHPLTALLKKPQRTEFDFIIIGSGAGGAPLAWSLAKKGFSVAIVEKGSIPTPQLASQAVEKYYVQQGFMASLENGITLVLAGSAVGGTTAINSGTCFRANTEQLKEWDRLLGTSFAQGSLDNYFTEVESCLGVTIPDRSLMSESSKIIEKGVEKLGRTGTYLLARNAPNCQGSGRCCFVCPTGAKQSTDRAFLPEALKNGASLFYESKATAIRETKNSVIVEIENADGKQTLTAKHLILSAGPLSTPGLIHDHQLGSHWKSAGYGLKIHPAAKVLAYFPELHHGEGGVPQGLGYHPPELPRIGLEGIHVPSSMLATTLANSGSNAFWWLQNHDHLASYGIFIRDRNSGRVISFPSLLSDPILRYRLHPEDARELGQGLLLIAEIFFAAGARKVLLPFSHELQELSSMEDVRKLSGKEFLPKNLVISGFHPQGTAAMGRVIDTDLNLLGCDRISVCDASIFPDSPGVNPMVTIMAFSLRLADSLEKKVR